VSARIVLIAATTRSGVIGADGAMPWRMSSDLKHFKAATMGKPLLMGRKTYASIGQPLPGRETIVLTRDPRFTAPGVLIVHDVGSGLRLARARAASMGASEAMVAGGGEVYRQTMDAADALLITELDLERAGDTRFPAIDPALWRLVSRVAHERGPRDEADFAVLRYERR
jgi:dihydrofolate reductase